MKCYYGIYNFIIRKVQYNIDEKKLRDTAYSITCSGNIANH